jgi:hypothetical protein
MKKYMGMVAFLAASCAQAVQFVNGNFDNGLTGWSVANAANSSTLVDNGALTFTGRSSDIWQALPTDFTSNVYQVTFNMSIGAVPSGGLPMLTIYAAGSVVAQYAAMPTAVGDQQYSFLFGADDRFATTTVRLSHVNAIGAGASVFRMDNFSVSQIGTIQGVPDELNTAAFLGLVLLSLAAARVRARAL